MGFGSISPGSLIIIFLIVLLIFGTKKLKDVGYDLAKAIKNFRKGMENENAEDKIKIEKDKKNDGN